MEIVFTEIAREDIAFWKKSGNKQIQKKINLLLLDIMQHPETGLGKPERLRHGYSGYWSRRINDEHRIMYEILENKIRILSLKGHYV